MFPGRGVWIGVVFGALLLRGGGAGRPEKRTMSFDPPPPPKAVFERLVPIAPKGVADPRLKVGFHFRPSDYAALKPLEKSSDAVLYAAPGCVRRHLKLTGEAEVHIAVSVHSRSVEAAREEFVGYILRSAMLPASGYAPGPAGFGDFCIVYAQEAPPNKIETLIHFMRANVGVTVRLARGKFGVPDLARQIDAKIDAAVSAKDLGPLCPQGLKGTLTRRQVREGESVTYAVEFDRKKDETYQVLVLTDNRLLKEESRKEGKVVWRARAPGVAPIRAVVWDSKLLSSTCDDSLKIVEDPNRKPEGAPDEE
jgi:hypothetical protein